MSSRKIVHYFIHNTMCERKVMHTYGVLTHCISNDCISNASHRSQTHDRACQAVYRFRTPLPRHVKHLRFTALLKGIRKGTIEHARLSTRCMHLCIAPDVHLGVTAQLTSVRAQYYRAYQAVRIVHRLCLASNQSLDVTAALAAVREEN